MAALWALHRCLRAVPVSRFPQCRQTPPCHSQTIFWIRSTYEPAWFLKLAVVESRQINFEVRNEHCHLAFYGGYRMSIRAWLLRVSLTLFVLILAGAQILLGQPPSQPSQVTAKATDLSRKIQARLNKTIVGKNGEEVSRIAASSIIIAAVIHEWNPQFTEREVQADLYTDIKAYGVNRGLIVPALALIDLSYQTGKPAVANIVLPALSKLNPDIGNLLHNELGLSTDLGPSISANPGGTLVGISMAMRSQGIGAPDSLESLLTLDDMGGNAINSQLPPTLDMIYGPGSFLSAYVQSSSRPGAPLVPGVSGARAIDPINRPNDAGPNMGPIVHGNGSDAPGPGIGPGGLGDPTNRPNDAGPNMGPIGHGNGSGAPGPGLGSGGPGNPTDRPNDAGPNMGPIGHGNGSGAPGPGLGSGGPGDPTNRPNDAGPNMGPIVHGNGSGDPGPGPHGNGPGGGDPAGPDAYGPISGRTAQESVSCASGCPKDALPDTIAGIILGISSPQSALLGGLLGFVVGTYHCLGSCGDPAPGPSDKPSQPSNPPQPQPSNPPQPQPSNPPQPQPNNPPQPQPNNPPQPQPTNPPQPEPSNPPQPEPSNPPQPQPSNPPQPEPSNPPQPQPSSPPQPTPNDPNNPNNPDSSRTISVALIEAAAAHPTVATTTNPYARVVNENQYTLRMGNDNGLLQQMTSYLGSSGQAAH